MPEMIQIPLTDLSIPSWNPRQFMDEGELQNLMTYLEKGGIVPRIWVWREGAEGPWLVISGQRRVEAYRRLGKTQIGAEVLAITLAEAKILAIASNQDDKPHWLDLNIAIEGLLKDDPTLTKEAIGTRIGLSRTVVSRKLKIMDLLNEASREAIRARRTLEEGSYQPSEKLLLRLTDLGDPQKVEEALKVAIDKKMTEPQAKALVASMLTGSSVDHPPLKLVRPALSKQSASKEPASIDSTPADRLARVSQSSTPAPAMSETEQVAWDIALGVSVLGKIKAKVKRGERPSFGEALLLGGDKLVHLLVYLTRWIAKNGIRGIFRGIKWIWHTFIESLKITGLYPLFRAICFLAFFLFAIWFGYEAYNYGWIKPVKVIGSKVPLVSWLITPSQNQTPAATPLATPLTTPVPTVVEAVVSTPTVTTMPKPRAKKKSTPVVVTNVQPTPSPKATPIKKTDVAGDILKAAPVVAGGVGNIAKSLGF